MLNWHDFQNWLVESFSQDVHVHADLTSWVRLAAIKPRDDQKIRTAHKHIFK